MSTQPSNSSQPPSSISARPTEARELLTPHQNSLSNTAPPVSETSSQLLQVEILERLIACIKAL